MDTDLGKCWLCKNGAGTLQCPGRCHLAVYCSQSCILKDKYRHEVECKVATALLTCRECGHHSQNLKACQGCFSSFYCGKNCQQKHWTQHKESCLLSSAQVMHLAVRWLRLNVSFASMPWYISSSIAEDYLRLGQNEGLQTNRTLKLLFVGSGDIRDVIRTIADLPSEYNGNLQIVLNDCSPHVMARNLLFLYCSLVHPSSQNAAHLVQIWYSMLLSTPGWEFLRSVLRELTTLTCEQALSKTKNLIDISENRWHQCCDIWNGWLRLSEERNASARLMKEREKIIMPELVGLYMVTRRLHMDSMEDFMQKGLLLPLNSRERSKAVKVNPTMACFNPTNPNYAFKYNDISPISDLLESLPVEAEETYEMIYCVRRDCYVFGCWDYLDARKVIGFQPDLMAMYKSYLEKIFIRVFDRMKEGKIHTKIIIDDFKRVDEYLSDKSKFDRICVSNLSDYHLTPVLLEKFGPMLNRENPCSVLVTHHQCWVTDMDELVNPLTHHQFVTRALKDSECRPDVLANQELMIQDPGGFNAFVQNYYSDKLHSYFQNFIIADFVVFLYKRKKAPLCRSSVKLMPQVLKGFGLRQRDYRRELNHVIPFFREELTRRLTCGANIKRHLEWLPC